MYKIITSFVLVACALLLRPQHITAIQKPIPVKPLSVQQYIVKYAQVYHVKEKLLLDVAFCESSFNPKAVGDKGKARNIFQFHFPTWQRFTKEMGEELDYNSYQDQAKVAAYAFSQGYQSHWSCYSKVKMVK